MSLSPRLPPFRQALPFYLALDPTHYLLLEPLLLRRGAQHAFLGGIGDISGLDEHRRDVGRLQYHEGRLLHFVFADGAHAIANFSGERNCFGEGAETSTRGACAPR